MLARLDHDGAAGSLLWHDAWDGFPAAVSCRLDRDRLTVDLQMVRTVVRPDAEKYTHASFVVEDSRPGAVQTAG
jgi:hypothetical protein